MSQILNISFPRSGHHLLINLLIKYFSKNLNEISTDGTKIKQGSFQRLKFGNFNYCEYYNHCNKIGCVDKTVNFQKNHDLKLNIPINKNKEYIVQYRYPLDSIISFYENFYDKKKSKKNWKKFAKTKIIYWKKFVNKWAIGKDFLQISYEDLVSNPQEKLIEVLKKMNVEDIDLEFIKKIKIPKKEKRDFTKFIYYDKEFFKKMENTVLRELKLLNIPKRFNHSKKNKSFFQRLFRV